MYWSTQHRKSERASCSSLKATFQITTERRCVMPHMRKTLDGDSPANGLYLITISIIGGCLAFCICQAQCWAVGTVSVPWCWWQRGIAFILPYWFCLSPSFEYSYSANHWTLASVLSCFYSSPLLCAVSWQNMSAVFLFLNLTISCKFFWSDQYLDWWPFLSDGMLHGCDQMLGCCCDWNLSYVLYSDNGFGWIQSSYPSNQRQ